MRGTVRLRGRLTAQTRCCDPRRRAPTRDVNRVFCEIVDEIDKKSMSVLGLAEAGTGPGSRDAEPNKQLQPNNVVSS